MMDFGRVCAHKHPKIFYDLQPLSHSPNLPFWSSVVRCIQLWKATAIPFQPGMGAFHPQPMMAMATNGAMPMMGVYGGEEYLGIEVGEIRGETPPKND